MTFLRAPFALVCAVALACAAVAQERLLTTALEVRSLSPAEADRGHPVKLRGVVVFVEGISAIFIQDHTSTTFFRVQTRPMPSVGDEIELTGKTRMGLFLPGVDYSRFTVLGRSALPPGIPAAYDDLYFGRYHYQRVSVEGIVRSVVPLDQNRSLVRLAMGSRVLEARIETPPESTRSLVDNRVRITGLAAGLINTPRRQLVQPYVRALNWSDVEVLAPAPPIADTPQISAEELLAFRVSGLGEQRVRIHGIVTAAFGEGQAYLQQAKWAFAVKLSGDTTLLPGDRVTVVGFPSMERFSASVLDAEILQREPGPAPVPIAVDSLDELYGKPGDQHPGKYDGHLVAVTVTVRDTFKSEDGTTLLVQSGQRTVQARLPDAASIPAIGTRIRLVGICQVESAVMGSGFASRPGLISLRPRDASDLDVVSRPSWWTPQRLSLVIAAMVGVTVLAGLWITFLRRQVRRQTDALRHRIVAQAASEERQRIAREFHDTLEQELAGVSLRLDALATRITDEKGIGLVSASRNLVSRIQSETRDLISDLRDPAETAGDLIAALEGIAARHTAEGTAQVRLESRPPIPVLPAATVHDLRMIARESVNNAVKHGRATHITIELGTSDSELVLRVVDNGCGFDPAEAVLAKRGHFGCAGMLERGRKIGAKVSWSSTLQKGATVEVRLPLGPPKESPTAPPFATAAPAAP